MKSRQQSGRREFLKRTLTFAGGALAGPFIIPASALGSQGVPAPGNRVNAACVGVGGMGNANMRSFLGETTVQMVAVCDVDARLRLGARDAVDRYYARRSESGEYKGCRDYNDFRDMLAKEDLDIVIVSTPDHWHTLVSLAAVRAGKDVYCEKPLTLTIAEGRVLADEVKRCGRVFQTGSQQRSSWEFRYACELVRNGRIGKLHTIRVRVPGGRTATDQPVMPVPDGFDYDLWLGQAPWAPYTDLRCHYNFRFIRDYSGGQLTNFGAHNLDIAQWGHGSDDSGPVEVVGEGEYPKGGLYNVPLKLRLEYTYSDGVKVICQTSGADVRFEGSEGWVYVARGRLDAEPKSLFTSVIGPGEIHLYNSRSHRGNFLDCMRSRRETVATAEIGHRTVSMSHLGNIAMLLGRKLKWDPVNERFAGDPEANRFISRPMRSPWRL